MRALAGSAAQTIGRSPMGARARRRCRKLAALGSDFPRRPHASRPPFDIGSVMVGDREVEVREEVALSRRSVAAAFPQGRRVAQPRVLVVAPLSGHFATLCAPP